MKISVKQYFTKVELRLVVFFILLCNSAFNQSITNTIFFATDSSYKFNLNFYIDGTFSIKVDDYPAVFDEDGSEVIGANFIIGKYEFNGANLYLREKYFMLQSKVETALFYDTTLETDQFQVQTRWMILTDGLVFVETMFDDVRYRFNNSDTLTGNKDDVYNSIIIERDSFFDEFVVQIFDGLSERVQNKFLITPYGLINTFRATYYLIPNTNSHFEYYEGVIPENVSINNKIYKLIY
jgi:hypothetical protein